MISEAEEKNKKNNIIRGGPKMVEEQNGENTFSPTNSSKDHLNVEGLPQNSF